jgi:hypothetical protein
MDAVEVWAALVVTLQFMLDEIRRHHPTHNADDLRDALLDLEELLHEWWGEAKLTNRWAAHWAAQLPESKGGAVALLTDYTLVQWDMVETAQDLFMRRLWRTGLNDFTLEQALRVYAPQVLDMAPLLLRRQRQLRVGVAETLEERFESGGSSAVEAYIEDLEETAADIDSFRCSLAEFISTELPK